MRVQNVSFTQSFVCAKNSKVNSNKLSIQPAAQTALGGSLLV